MKYPEIDPLALAVGPLQIHWYGLMYLFGFAAAWLLASRRARQAGSLVQAGQVEDLIFYAALGVILGGRIGYSLFYAGDRLLADPFYLLRIWEGGMSFHGGLLGVLLALYFFARRQRISYFQTTDFVAPLVPLGLFFGRLGNFINGELWGGPTTLPWGMQLPCARFPGWCQGAGQVWSLPLHPSQLYQAALEGLLLFVLLWWFSARPRPVMAVSGLFLLGYGALRFAVEFVRLPDAHLGYLAWNWLTMGQLLSLPMLLAGALLLALAYRRPGQS
jgi:phosphatidylglycerol:prolipoprotein diacylglycerol transferase